MSGHAIQRIRPRMERVETPQCCVEIARTPAVPSVYWKHRHRRDDPKGFDVNRCAMSSAFEIDGKHYCTRHAGMVALDILLRGETASAEDSPTHPSVEAVS